MARYATTPHTLWSTDSPLHQTWSWAPTRQLAAWIAARRAAMIVTVMAGGWGGGFGWLALQRHLAGGSHAEDLGFTEQVLANFLRGQWFRMSIYQGATWNTEIDLSRIARADSLLAFHFEPMLLLLAPLYALGGISLLLVMQALAVAAGALPAYRLGRYGGGSATAGTAVAGAYLLSPLGQWAVLSDFHPSTVAAPLLLLTVERLVVKKSTAHALVAGSLAATAREDVGAALATLGLVILLRHAAHRPWMVQDRKWLPGLALLGLGLGSSVLAAAVIRSYSGGGLPLDARYAETIGGGSGAFLAALGRPLVLGYAQTLLLSGGWLALFAPLALVPALPGLALNALSASPWMAAGKAHYSGLVLPFIVIGAAAGLGRGRAMPRLVPVLSGTLVLSSALGYLLEGSGPFGGNYAPASQTQHAIRAENLALGLPPDATVSASSALVPRLSKRAHVYVFPAVLDAEYVLVDAQASPSPTSAGDVFLRTRAMLAGGGWQVQTADDGLLLLHRVPDSAPTAIGRILAEGASGQTFAQSQGSYAGGRVSLLAAELVPSPDGAIDVDGPRWILRTTWRAEQPLPEGSHIDFWLSLSNSQQVHLWDIASLWWNPPAQWIPGQAVTVDVPDVPIRQFVSWQAVFQP